VIASSQKVDERKPVIKTNVERALLQRLQLKFETELSSFAFSFNLRAYITGSYEAAAVDCSADFDCLDRGAMPRAMYAAVAQRKEAMLARLAAGGVPWRPLLFASRANLVEAVTDFNGQGAANDAHHADHAHHVIHRV